MKSAKQLQRLNDEEWARVAPLLSWGRKGARRVDDRRAIAGIVFRLRGRARWRDCLSEFGPCTTVYTASTAGAGRGCGRRCSRR
ncbi:transposase [Xanthobacter variabilis]|uniref:transposase n=1 Tax=Xanthobacter variabilis TaxID=3119932 RepID=UPI00372D6C39